MRQEDVETMSNVSFIIFTFILISGMYLISAALTYTVNIPEIEYGLLPIGLVAAINFPLNYFLIKHKGRYKKILEEFKDETPKERRRRNYEIVIYLVSIFILLIVCAKV